MRRRITALVAVGIGSLLAPESRGQPAAEQRGICFRGRPPAVCRGFWVTEVGYYHQLVVTKVEGVLPPASPTRAHLESHVSWELGGMVNRGRAHSVGATGLR